MSKKQIMLLVLAVAVTIGSGVLHGHLNQRWGIDQKLDEASNRLSEFPQSFGSWKLESEKTLGKSAVELLRCAGYLNNIYVNEKTGEHISVTVIVGPGHTMAIHTPEICYSAKNFRMLGSRRKFRLAVSDSIADEFWAVDFEVNDVTAKELRVHYAWTVDGHWQAPDRPRLAFAGERMLYKIQLAEYLSSLQIEHDDTVNRFLKEFLPVLRACINPS